METLNCMKCKYRHEDNGNCTAVGGFCTAVTAAHCPLLREYLDTGLEPEAVETLNNTPISRLVELAEADKDRRVVVLPCKVGDTVYMIERIFDIDNGVCDEICARKVIGHGGNNLNELWLVGSGGICNAYIFVSEFGKTVFLTREEAERATEEMEGKNDGNETSM